MKIEVLDLLLGGAGILGFLATIITLLANRRKTKAETEKLIAETEENRIKAQHDLQTQLDELREQNKKLFVDRETEREAKEKLRNELNRLHDDIELIRRELFVERQRNMLLSSELDTQRSSNLEKKIKIDGLESLVSQQQRTLEKYGSDIGVIKKQTGQLNLPARDGKE